MANTVWEKGPQFVRYFQPVLDALKQLGGSGRPEEVEETVAESLGLSEQERNEQIPSGQSRFSNKINWAVNASQVRDFRGAMMGRADKGIILTTGSFTADARKEAVRDGVPPIELVDGEKLLDMFEELELGLKPKKAYEIDASFFDEFRL